jgi:hypothetical protein
MFEHLTQLFGNARPADFIPNSGMTGSGLGLQFRLNLTNIAKMTSGAAPDAVADRPADPEAQARPLLKPDVVKAATIQAANPAEAAPGASTTLARKNLVLRNGSSDDEDLALELIPVGVDDQAEKADTVPDVIEAPAVAISHLPDLIDREDDDDSPEGG